MHVEDALMGPVSPDDETVGHVGMGALKFWVGA